MNVIRQSNYRLHLAIIRAHLNRDAATICEVRDAINARRRMRTIRLSAQEHALIDAHYRNQLRTYGRVEIPYEMA